MLFENLLFPSHISMKYSVSFQTAATEEKTILEEAQRSAANERKVKCEEWIPQYFAQVSPNNTLYVSVFLSLSTSVSLSLVSLSLYLVS